MRKENKDIRRTAQRRRALVALTSREVGVDVIWVSSPVSIRYLTGCTEGAAGLLMGRDWACILTGKMFEHVIPAQAPGVEVVVTQSGVLSEAANVLRKRKHRKAIGFEGGVVSWAGYGSLHAAMGRRKLVDIGNTVTRIRSVKDAGEIRLIRKCVRIAEAAFLEVVARGARQLIAMTERELASELEYRMRQLGADRQGFPDNGIIVASGPNSASCHHVPTNRKPRKGEPLLFDWGAELDGYRSDITRTVFLGKPEDTLRDVYEVVERANAVGRRAVRPGVACDTVARQSWDVVRDAGWGDEIRHGLGHGVGLEIHELPRFGNGSAGGGNRSVRLRRNMVITIEPGLYLQGLGGVRIEDDVVVTAKGRSVLTTLPRGYESAIVRSE